MSLYFIAPGVYPETIDLSDRTQAPSTSVGAVVVVSNKGPVERTFVSNPSDFKDLYGIPDARLGWGHHTALFFLAKSSMLYVKRVTKNSRYAGAVVFNDRAGADATQTYMVPFPTGRFDGYTEDERASQKIYTLKLSGPMLTGQSIQIAIDARGSGGPTALAAPVVFTTNSDNTLRLFANAVRTLINRDHTASPAGYWTVGKNTGGVGVISAGSAINDDRLLWVIVPEDSDFDITGATVTGSGQIPTVDVQEATALFELYAENPGAWGNDVGMQILNVDNGVRQRRRLTFSRPMAGTESFRMGIQWGASTYAQVDAVPYVTSQAATMAAVKAAIETALATVYATGWEVRIEPGDLEITVTAPVDGANRFTFFDPQIVLTTNGNATDAIVSNSQVRQGVDRSDAFDLWIYKRDNVNFPKEKHRVSFRYQVDGFGIQQFLEEKVNKADDRSKLVRALYMDSEDSAYGNSAGILVGITSPTPICWLGGGTDTDIPEASDLMVAWNDFSDRRKCAVRLLLNGGLTNTAVQRHMCALAEKRRDCFAILDMPTAYQNASDAVTYRNDIANFDTSYAAIYTPNVGRVDEFTNRKLFIPPSGFVGAQFADSDRRTAEWFAPAGLTRGQIDTVELRQVYSDGEIELLFSNGINPIVKRSGQGYPIWGAETLQARASALSNISVRRLLITIEITLVDALEYQIYEPNDPYTWFQATQVCNNLLQPIKEKRGLYQYLVVANETNNKAYHIDMGLMNLDVLLKPVLPVKYIRLASVVTKTGAVFSEILGLLNGSNNNLSASMAA